jgi:endonuclease YncB( thermonuclease family)
MMTAMAAWSKSLMLLVLAAGLSVTGAALAEINGRVRVIDAGTIEMAGQPVRLFGIDAPADGQLCERDGAPWRCGQEAGWALAARIELHWVLCDERELDGDGRVVAICYIGGRQGINLNAWMVENGWALADRRTATDYVGQEAAAQRERRGIWAGRFDAPAEWRRAHSR